MELVIPKIGADYVLNNAMFSGLEVQASVMYTIHQRAGRRWAVGANVPNSADYIYADGGQGSQGFAGRTLKFKIAPFELRDLLPSELTGLGDSVDFIGPWHSNSEALYKATGYDVRNKHLTWCCASEERTGSAMTGVVWCDPKPQVGLFNRPDALAKVQEIVNRLQRPLFFYKESHGGSTSYQLLPQ